MVINICCYYVLAVMLLRRKYVFVLCLLAFTLILFPFRTPTAPVGNSLRSTYVIPNTTEIALDTLSGAVVNIPFLPQDILGSCALSRKAPYNLDGRFLKYQKYFPNRRKPSALLNYDRYAFASPGSGESLDEGYTRDEFCHIVEVGINLPYPMWNARVCKMISFFLYYYDSVKVCDLTIDYEIHAELCSVMIPEEFVPKDRLVNPHSRQAKFTNFFWSKGVAAATDFSPSLIIDDGLILPTEDYKAGIESGGTFYVVQSQIHSFIKEVSHLIQKPFIIVTGSSIEASPFLSPSRRSAKSNKLVQTFLENPLLIAWFGQNLDYLHEKVLPLPLGVDFHTFAKAEFRETPNVGSPSSTAHQDQYLHNILCSSTEIHTRPETLYMNFNAGSERPARIELLNALSAKPFVDYQPPPIAREKVWNYMSDVGFVISPPGVGKDCHRTWETLSLGTPLVLYHDVYLEIMLQGLPAYSVRDWHDINEDYLHNIAIHARNNWLLFQWEKVRSVYWLNLIELVLEQGSTHEFYNIEYNEGGKLLVNLRNIFDVL